MGETYQVAGIGGQGSKAITYTGKDKTAEELKKIPIANNLNFIKMERLLSLYIKECLTIIVKYILFSLLLITNLTCNKIDKQNFKIFGENDLLRNTKINIVETGETGKKTEKTFLFKGEIYDVEAEAETGVVYEVYVSYKDSLVNVLKFENVMRNANDYINHIYLTNTDN